MMFLLRTVVAATWFLLAVAPGFLVMLAHRAVSAGRGRPVRPWPLAVYRGLGLAIGLLGWVAVLWLLGTTSPNPAAR